MSQRTLISSSAGTFWSISEDNDWSVLLLDRASVIRTTDRQSTPNPVISSYSSTGGVNTVVVKDQDAKLNAGSSTSNLGATYFGFPLTHPDGEPVNLGLDHFTLDLFLEITANPGEDDDNNVMIGIGINDGTSSMENGRLGGLISYDQAEPRIGSFGSGGGISFVARILDQKYIRVTTTTTPLDEPNPFNFVNVLSYSDANEYKKNRYTFGENIYMSPAPPRPSGSNAFVFVTIGKNGAAGSGDKTFSFKSYYKLNLHSFEGVGTERPG